MRISLTGNAEDLPIREKDGNINALRLSLSPAPTKSKLLVSVEPPRQPSVETHHVPCDIVLVIDVSGSMGSAAPVPGEDASEASGLSVLDLVKHASLTIIETMDERDRLSIVTFASTVTTLQGLEVMTEANKEKARENIKRMVPNDCTNLWHGILTGIKQFNGFSTAGKVPAILVLTDGMPNHMCPQAGYVPKLTSMLPLPAPIHTFGFGYSLRSGLLKSIAEIGNGSYAFIPDAGMIGTVFVHAAANFQSTYATDATLTLNYAQPLHIEETTGSYVGKQSPEPVLAGGPYNQQLKIPIGAIQYGQSRDIVLHYDASHLAEASSTHEILATLEYNLVVEKSRRVSSTATSGNVLNDANIPDAKLAYHDSRSQICAYLSSLFPIGPLGEHAHVPLPMLEDKKEELMKLIKELPAKAYSDDLNQSLVEDLAGQDPRGQISLAVNREDYFGKWGKHYLPSLLNAYARQACNSFKDPGPLQFGSDSPLFIACRSRLDDLFDTLPAPTPSIVPYPNGARSRGGGGGWLSSTLSSIATPAASSTISMKRWHNPNGVCFAGSTPVELASGRKIEIKRLRRGMKVRTPLGSRKIAAVLKTPVQNETLCKVGSIFVTPWHPISRDGKAWTFPAYSAEKAVRYTGSIYSIMLQRDRNPDAHAIRLDGTWGVTLGHGLVRGGDARAHAFFGEYELVSKSLMRLAVGLRGEFVGFGVERDRSSGLVCGFRPDESRTRVLAWRPPTITRTKTLLRDIST